MDKASGFRVILILIKHKSDVFEFFQKFEKMVHTKFGRRMSRLRSDRGGKIVSDAMENYLEGVGIVHEKTAPYTPEQDGRAERKLRTVVEPTRTMLYARSSPLFL